MEEHHHFDYDRVAELRKKYIPDSVVKSMVDPGKKDTIVDIGAGDGHFSILFSRSASKVIAMDVSRRSVELIKERVLRDSLSNLEIIQSDVCGEFNLRDFNKVFFGTSFHDLPCGENIIDLIRSRGSNDVQVTFLEFKKEESPGPPLEIRIDPHSLQDMMNRHGFTLKSSVELKIHYIHTYVVK